MTTLAIDVPENIAAKSQRIADKAGISLSELATAALERELRMYELGRFVEWAERKVGKLTEEEIEAAERELSGDA